MPRSGKTTCLARYLKKNFYKYDHVYISGEVFQNFDDEFVTYIHPYEIGSFRPIDNSLFIICEAGTYFNNRLINKIPTYCTDFFALHGHYHCDILWDSQSVDVDKKLRDRTNRLYVVNKSLLPWFSHVVRIKHWIGVNPDTRDLAETYTIPQSFFKKLLSVLTFGTFWIFRPIYYRLFDSYSDNLFNGKPCLDFQIVSENCPTKYFKLLTNYIKICEDYKNEIKAQQEKEKLHEGEYGSHEEPS